MGIRRLFDHPRVPWIAAAIAVALGLPALFAGIQGDDYFQRAVYLGLTPIGEDTNPLLDLFAFAGDRDRLAHLIDLGFYPWWTHPELEIRFFRPVTAILGMLDHALWPNRPALHHAHNLLWFGLSVLVVAKLYRRVHGAVAVAGLAALLFAVEDAHAMPAVWLANRNALIALTFGVLAVIGHVEWRRSGRPMHLVGALVALVVGLCSGEAALGAVAYVFAWQVTMDGGSWGRRVGALVPYAVVVVAWRIVYDALGCGTVGCGLYVDPGSHPLQFVGALVLRWPLLLAAQWWQLSADLWAGFDVAGQIALSVIGGALSLVALALLWRPLRERPEARFWALGMALSLVPLCAAFPMTRLLIFSGVGAFGLLAVAADCTGWVADEPRRGGRLRRWGTGTLLVFHGPLAVVLFLAGVLTFPMFGQMFSLGAREVPTDEALQDQTLVVVNGNEFPLFYLTLMRELDDSGPVPRRLALLSTMNAANTVTREDDRTVAIGVDGGMLAIAFDRLMRDLDPPFEAGDSRTLPDYTVTVREVTADGRPLEIEFVFEQPLEHPGYRWMCWTGQGLQEFTLPAVGESVHLPLVGLLQASYL